MVNEFGSMAYTDHCSGGGGLGAMFGDTLSSSQARMLNLFERSQAGDNCEPILGNSILGSFELDGRSKWSTLTP
jgi:hypothetical protein